MTTLEIRALSFRYRQQPVLNDVSFALPPGEFAVLLGLNGAGKTTLFSLIAGLLPLQQGGIAVLSHRLPSQHNAALAGTGFVFQQSSLDLDLSVAQSLRYHAALHGLSRRVADARIADELERFGLADRLHQRLRHLSGGQRRRVEIARSLLHRPRLLLFDEPTVGLDVPARLAILERAHALTADTGATVLWATHLLDEIAAGDRVLLLERGQLVEDIRADGSTERLARRLRPAPREAA